MRKNIATRRVTVDRSPLWDFWIGGAMMPLRISVDGKGALLAYVRNLYNSGPEYQQDGTPEAVTDDLWFIARSRSI